MFQIFDWKQIESIFNWFNYRGGRIELRTSSVCCIFFVSNGWSFLFDVGLPSGPEMSIGVGDVDFNALAFYNQ